MRCAICGHELEAVGAVCPVCEAARAAQPALTLEVERAPTPSARPAPPPPPATASLELGVDPAAARPSVRPSVRPASIAPGPALASASAEAIRPAPQPVPPDLTLEFDYDTPLVNGAALPIALGFALALQAAGLGLLVYATACMWTHELGHAIAGWLIGLLSIPLPFFTIYTSDDRNPIVIGLVLVAWLALGAHGVRQRSAGLIAGAAAIAAGQLWLTVLATPGRALQWFTFAGLAGEILLSTVMMLAFYVRFPWRWDFWRYPVLFTCAVAYVHAFVRWIGVATGTADLPRGSAIGDNAEGDVEKLLRTGEFTEATLAQTCLWLCIACGVVMAVVYVRMLRKARRLAAERLAAPPEPPPSA